MGPLSAEYRLTSDSLYEISMRHRLYSIPRSGHHDSHPRDEGEPLIFYIHDLVQAGKTRRRLAQNSEKITVDYIDLAPIAFAANYPDYDLKPTM